MKDDITDLWDLLVAYVRQETIDPLKGLVRYAAFGVAGSLTLVIGIGMVVLGVLRLLQDETGSTFTGHLSWIPYCIVAGATLGIAAGSAAGIARVKSSETRDGRGAKP